MRSELVVRDDAERVAAFPAGSECRCVVGAQNEAVSVRSGKSKVLCLLSGHIVTVHEATVDVSKTFGEESMTNTLTRVRASDRVRQKRRNQREMTSLGKSRRRCTSPRGHSRRGGWRGQQSRQK
jgi:hypothetical protein